MWLAPEQVRVLPISEKQIEYGRSVLEKLRGESLRASIDDRSETIGAKIRDATMEKVPTMLILGAREMESGNVSVRVRTGGDLGSSSLGDFLLRVKEEVRTRRASETPKQAQG
jgi:threonyl-tRNA synthetase